MDITKKVGVGIGLLGFAGSTIGDGWDPGSDASALGSIVNTRHNLTVSYSPNAVFMNSARNDYGAVCVYCHTPHGGNKQVDAPLWNRTVNSPSSYTIYDKPTTLMQPIGTPGPNSLTCLSCHDGTIAIDSVLNMPGSGLDPLASGLSNNEVGTANQAFLDKWPEAGLPGSSGYHFTLGPELGVGDDSNSCAICHKSDISDIGNFRAVMLGTDLRDEHPIGVLYPDLDATPDVDFNAPNVKISGGMAFFDLDGDSHADPAEVRLYDTGEGYEVECASCHDPHGVPSDGTGTRFNPSFLRVNNGIGDGITQFKLKSRALPLFGNHPISPTNSL